MNWLKRNLAPITPEAWAEIEAEAARVLKLHLAGRKVVDFNGPLGRHVAAISTGRLSRIAPPRPDVLADLRVSQPLVETCAPFTLSIRELDDLSRGAADIDLQPLIDAAIRIAAAEDHAIFSGYDAAMIRGVVQAAEHPPMTFAQPRDMPLVVVDAKETLRKSGVNGPYALVLGSALYDELYGAAEGGFPIRDRVAPMVERLVWAPSLEGAALVSIRGGDFELTVGQDLSIGYAGHTRTTVDLYLTESFTFRVLSANAAIGIRRVA